MGRGSSKAGGGSHGAKPSGIDAAKTLQEAFDALNTGEYIELKTPGSLLSSGIWLPYKKTAWGFDRASRPGYYNMPGESMVMVRDFGKYDNRWRKLTDYNKNMFNL